MYSRSIYNDSEESPRLPENYDGNAFKEQISPPSETPLEDNAEMTSAKPDEGAKSSDLLGSVSSVFSSLPFVGGLFKKQDGGLFPRISQLKFGTEELIIIGAAAYLFFSGQGDKECAVMLLLLLLVN